MDKLRKLINKINLAGLTSSIKSGTQFNQVPGDGKKKISSEGKEEGLVSLKLFEMEISSGRSEEGQSQNGGPSGLVVLHPV